MKKALKNTILILLFLTLSTSTALLAYLHFFSPEAEEYARDQDLSGEWTTDLDMTQRAAVTALSWLQEVEGVSVSLEDMAFYMQDLTVRVSLTLEQSARAENAAEGTFRCYVLPESYDACRQSAYEAFAMAFRELVAERLLMAGYKGGTDEDDLEALVTETFGMSTVSYLMAYAPALLPSLEELQAQYDGSGSYEAAEGVLTRRSDTGGTDAERVESYIRKGGTLILSGETDSAGAGLFSDQDAVIYTLQE
ncbi:MAG: hypothetical protein NC254_08265 [bacterium]|nr:hypothetical protein [bacterium]